MHLHFFYREADLKIGIFALFCNNVSPILTVSIDGDGKLIPDTGKAQFPYIMLLFVCTFTAILRVSLRFSAIPSLRPRSFVDGNKRMRRARFIFIKELIFIRPQVDSFLLVHLPPRFPFPRRLSSLPWFSFSSLTRFSCHENNSTERHSFSYAFPIRLLCCGSYDTRLLRNKIDYGYILDILNRTWCYTWCFNKFKF